MITEHEIQATRTTEESVPIDTEAPEQPIASHNVSLTASRQRAYAADLTKAHVALMEREVILPKQLELFRLVNRHYRILQAWHDQYTGWRIQRDTSAIRLIRHLSATTPGYLYERLKEPRDFACLTWMLWFAENRQLTGRGNDQQFLLSQLAEQLQEQSAHGAPQGHPQGAAPTIHDAPPGHSQGAAPTIHNAPSPAALDIRSQPPLDFRKPSDRYSMQRALQYLEDLGGLQLVDGQTREWVEQTTDADVLYEFTDATRSLVAALNPQLLASVSTRLNNEATTLQPTLLANATGTPDLIRAWRALLLGPALFKYDDPVAFAALLKHADVIANEMLEIFGWLIDISRDYACVVRASGMSTGPVTSLTPYGTNDQIAMLLCKAIRDQVNDGTWSQPDAYGCLHVTTEDMAALFYSVRERYGEHWGSEARSKSSRSLLNEVYRKMRQIGLLRGPDTAGNMLVLPTAARYTASYDKGEQETTTSRAKSKSKSMKEVVVVELPGLD